MIVQGTKKKGAHIKYFIVQEVKSFTLQDEVLIMRYPNPFKPESVYYGVIKLDVQ